MPAKDEPIVERAELIRKAMIKVAKGIEAALQDNPKPDIEVTTEALSGVLTLAQVTITAINEIAYNVGRLADATERDLRKEVESAAETLATEKLHKNTKRSYIGMPK